MSQAAPALVIIAGLGSIAGCAGPVTLACEGDLRLTVRGTVEKYTLSITIDEKAGAVTVQNYGSVPISSKRDDTVWFMARNETDGRWFDKWVSWGSINRLTGAVYITYLTDNDGVHIFQGSWRPAQRLF
jgi:hypothetical protein